MQQNTIQETKKIRPIAIIQSQTYLSAYACKLPLAIINTLLHDSVGNVLTCGCFGGK